MGNSECTYSEIITIQAASLTVALCWAGKLFPILYFMQNINQTTTSKYYAGKYFRVRQRRNTLRILASGMTTSDSCKICQTYKNSGMSFFSFKLSYSCIPNVSWLFGAGICGSLLILQVTLIISQCNFQTLLLINSRVMWNMNSLKDSISGQLSFRQTRQESSPLSWK